MVFEIFFERLSDFVILFLASALLRLFACFCHAASVFFGNVFFRISAVLIANSFKFL